MTKVALFILFAALQWPEENSASVINKKQVILGEDLQLKEGLTVDVLLGKIFKGQSDYPYTNLFGELNWV